MVAINRWFYRCVGCLEVVALEEQLRLEWGLTVEQCSTCGQRFELMGRVARDSRLEKDQIVCVCDDRRISARGPLCSCHCGGKNHGIGMAGYIMRTVDAGKVPVVSMPTTESKARNLAAWQAYAAARATLKASIEPLIDARCAGQYLERPAFDRLRNVQRAILAADKARTHAGRVKILAPFAVVPSVVSTHAGLLF